MNDGVKIASISAVAVVTILSFILLPENTTLHNNLVYGLLSLVGVNIIGAGIGTLRNWLK